ncbi:hypothetical protein SDC9_136700 [bioreactor metagenome]|uniref:Uncharacterized protein n=1 Tax=bioreactor metagenome TaxID=1076179 RepID=A0A645DKJ7_9ZZZZ
MADIELHHLRSRAISGVRNVQRETQRRIPVKRGGIELKIGIGKRCIGESVTEGITDRHVPRIIITVANEDAFAVFHRSRVSGEIGEAGGIIQPKRPAFCELSARADLAGNNVRNRPARSLTAQVTKQDGFCAIRPAQIDHRSAGKHDRYVWIDRAHPADEFDVIFRHVEGLAVKSFGFVSIRQADEQQHGILPGGEGAGFR